LAGEVVTEDSASKNETLSLPASYLVGGNLVISGRRTSVRLELEMWDALEETAGVERCTIHDLGSRANSTRKTGQSLTSAIRVFLLLYYRNQVIKASGTGTLYQSDVKRPSE
jgi:predicted DNA-binding ribbon-helix-helix protein